MKQLSPLKRIVTERGPWFLLAIILLAGLGVRLSGISTESIWWDEFTSVIHLDPIDSWLASPHYQQWSQAVVHEDADSLFAFLRNNRKMDPATMPLYYSLEYGWWNYIGGGVISLRLLSLLIGLSLIPALFITGRYLFGSTGGLVAAFCAAFSPVHRQFSHEIRMYGLFTLLACLSIYTFMRVLREGGKRWWTLHLAVNFLLLWVHPFAVLIPFIEGLFLLATHWRKLRTLFAWAGAHALIALPSLIYILSIQFWGQESTNEWMRLPNLRELAGDLFADDCVGFTYQQLAKPFFWESLLGSEFARQCIQGRFLVGRWMITFFLLLIAGLLVYTVWRGLRQRDETTTAEKPEGRWTFFLVLWWLGPPILLYLISAAWRPCIMPRYTLYASLGMYLLLGGAVAALPKKGLRIAATVILVAFYSFQQSLLIMGPQHPDYQSAALRLHEEAQGNDLILVHNWLWKRVFLYNLGPVPNVVSYGKTWGILAEACRIYVDRNIPALDTPDAYAQSWALIRTEYFESGPCRDFEAALKQRGLSFEFWEFGGIQHVLLYRVWREGKHAPPETLLPLDPYAPVNLCDIAMDFWRVQQFENAEAYTRSALAIDPAYSRGWSYLGMTLKELHRNTEAIDAFERAIALKPEDYPWSHINLGMLLIEEGRYHEARDSLLRAGQYLEQDSWRHTCLGKAYIGLKEYRNAQEALERAIELDPNDIRPRQVLEALPQEGRS